MTERLDEDKFGYRRPKEVYDDVVYNFAYGSNIYPPDKLSARRSLGTDGGSGGVHFESFELASVQGWRLTMDIQGLGPSEPCFAGASPITRDSQTGYHVAGAIQGALIKLTRTEYEKLWASEGGSAGLESPYTELAVTATRARDDSTERAVILTGRPRYSYASDLRPSMRYKNLICRGARHLGVSSDYQAFLDSIPTNPPFRLSAVATTLGARNVRSTIFIHNLVARTGCPPVKKCVLWFVFGSVRMNKHRVDAVHGTETGALMRELLFEVVTLAWQLPGAALSIVLDSTSRVQSWFGGGDDIMLSLKKAFSED